MKLFLSLVLLTSAAWAQLTTTCTQPVNQPQDFAAGQTIVLRSYYGVVAGLPPTAIAILHLNSDCSLTGVGNPAFSGTWDLGNGYLDLSINVASWNGSSPVDLQNISMRFYTVSGLSAGNFGYPAPIQKFVMFSTGVVTNQPLNPNAVDANGNEIPAFQITAWPKGF